MFEGLKSIREEINNAVISNPDRDEIRDGYQLRFVGKDYAKFIATLPTETVLVPDTKWNNDKANQNSQNIFITGDNLDALKHLVNAYEKQVNCIYIDPPYNTGSDGFVYNDTFNFTDAALKEKLGMTDSEISRLRALNGKCSHPAWLTFMLPRLLIAKKILANDGVIFISIDDNEQANLKLICDEIFGEPNFVACCPRKTRGSATTQSDAEIQKLNDYVLIYWKNKAISGFNLKTSGTKTYPYSDDRGEFFIVPLQDNGPHGTKTARPNLWYPIYQSGDNKLYLEKQTGADIAFLPAQHKNDEGCWMWSKAKFERDKQDLCVKDNKIYIKHYYNPEEDQNKYQRQKSWLDEFQNSKGTVAVNNLFSEAKGLFDSPKPVELLKYILTLATEKDSLVLDFFAGSATTADAVMQLNAEDNGTRKYIMVQLDEKVKDGSEAANAGYKTIDEISRERIKRAAASIGDKSGFKHYKLAKVSDALILDKIDNFDPSKPNLLADDMIKPFAGTNLGTGLQATGLETILTTWMIDDGYTLTTPIEEIRFGNYIAYSPKDSRRLYLISDGWSTDNTRDLLNKIGRNELGIQTIIIYNHSFDFKSLTELKNNIKSVLEGNIEIIERF